MFQRLLNFIISKSGHTCLSFMFWRFRFTSHFLVWLLLFFFLLKHNFQMLDNFLTKFFCQDHHFDVFCFFAIDFTHILILQIVINCFCKLIDPYIDCLRSFTFSESRHFLNRILNLNFSFFSFFLISLFGCLIATKEILFDSLNTSLSQNKFGCLQRTSINKHFFQMR